MCGGGSTTKETKERAQRENSGVMRLSCSGVLFPLSIRVRTALLLAIVSHLPLRKPIQGNSFCSFRSFVFHQLSRHQLRCYLSPYCRIYRRLLNTWNYICLPNGALAWKYFRVGVEGRIWGRIFLFSFFLYGGNVIFFGIFVFSIF